MTESNTPTILPSFRKAFEGDGFKSDARIFLTVGDDVFTSIVETLKAATGILGPSRFGEAIAIAGVTDENQAELLLRIIPIFTRWGRTIARGKFDALVATLHVALEKEFSESDRRTLASRMVQLLEGDFPGLALAEKTQSVARATGRKLKSLQLITDVRPVFDDDRQQVLAVVPMTTLKITTDFSDEGVSPSTWEVQLSELDLRKLSNRLAAAQQKLAVMKKLLNEKNLSIADCEMVLTDEEEA